VVHSIDPYLRNWADPVLILQVVGERYSKRRLAPLKNPVKSRTVEDTLRAVDQAHARLGALDLRNEGHGGIYFWIQPQINAYKKVDNPPKRSKPIPILIIVYILDQAYGDQRNDVDLSLVDIITIAFFFLLRQGEYTGTTADDTLFRLQAVGLHIGQCRIDVLQCSKTDLESSTYVSYIFKTHNNGIKG
jgi:hypothetical protein